MLLVMLGKRRNTHGLPVLSASFFGFGIYSFDVKGAAFDGPKTGILILEIKILEELSS